MNEEYLEYCAECRACGIQPMTAREWLADQFDPKAAAQDRYADLYDGDVLDLY